MDRYFFQRHRDGQQAREKMFYITSHQRIANQDQDEKSPHTFQNGCYQKNTNKC